ncbi:hypothetical protein HanPI659440_Chr05g0208401 [Helianthus annuus]|nr:hypothetical protein HanPI659440_Chr05g0208401 [Helianthus annuus]
MINAGHKDLLLACIVQVQLSLMYFSVLGCFFGLSLALTVAIIVSVHARDLLKSQGRTQYMNTIFPLYSMFGFLVLHILMYGGNVYFYARYRVNYSFIFGFKPSTELGFKEVLLLGFGLSVLTLEAVLSNLQMELDPQTKSYKTFTELLPLALVIVRSSSLPLYYYI